MKLFTRKYFLILTLIFALFFLMTIFSTEFRFCNWKSSPSLYKSSLFKQNLITKNNIQKRKFGVIINYNSNRNNVKQNYIKLLLKSIPEDWHITFLTNKNKSTIAEIMQDINRIAYLSSNLSNYNPEFRRSPKYVEIVRPFNHEAKFEKFGWEMYRPTYNDSLYRVRQRTRILLNMADALTLASQRFEYFIYFEDDAEIINKQKTKNQVNQQLVPGNFDDKTLLVVLFSNSAVSLFFRSRLANEMAKFFYDNYDQQPCDYLMYKFAETRMYRTYSISLVRHNGKNSSFDYKNS